MSQDGLGNVPWYDRITGEPTTPPTADELFDVHTDRTRQLQRADLVRDQADELADLIPGLERQIGYNRGYYAPGTGERPAALAQFFEDIEQVGSEQARFLFEADRDSRLTETQNLQREIIRIQQAEAEAEAEAEAIERQISLRDARINQYLEENGVDYEFGDDYGESMLALAQLGKALPSEILDPHPTVGRLLDAPHRLLQDEKLRTLENGGVAFNFSEFTVDDAAEYMAMEALFAAYGDPGSFPPGEAADFKNLVEQIAGLQPALIGGQNPVRRDQYLRDELRDRVTQSLRDNEDLPDFPDAAIVAVTDTVFDRLRDGLDFSDGGQDEFVAWAELLVQGTVSFSELGRRSSVLTEGVNTERQLIRLLAERDAARASGDRRRENAITEALARLYGEGPTEASGGGSVLRDLIPGLSTPIGG